jgi:hypothetical protein
MGWKWPGLLWGASATPARLSFASDDKSERQEATGTPGQNGLEIFAARQGSVTS